MKPVLLVLVVDALGWELASQRPGFLSQLQHRRPLATILGFSSGALPTLFTGRLPQEHGRWLMYRRADRTGVFAGFERLAALPRRLRESHRFGQWLTRTVSRRGVRGYFNLYEVPRAELAQFDLPERGDIFVPGGLPVDSWWDGLQRSGLSWRGWNWRTPESESLAAALAVIGEGRTDVVFVYTADLDALLHRDGSHARSVADRLGRYETWLDSAFVASQRAGREPWAIVCSDHGMVDVTACADVMGRLKGLPERRGRDYWAFFDSTMARFWWTRPAARDRVRAALAEEPAGHWCTHEELAREGCVFADARYGDDVFLLDPGVLMVPSFMGSRPVAAMHGYDPSHVAMAAFIASNRPLPESTHHIADVRGLLDHATAVVREGG